jgi:YihY family inner membrane protein
MEMIFHHRRERHSRHLAVSLLLPYVFICFLSIGLLLITVVSGALHWVDTEVVHAFGRDWALYGTSGVVLYLLGLVGLIFIFTSMYMVFPVGRIRFSHALLGGATAAILWEITRHVLVWYYATLSMVQVVYGTFATAVVSLLTFEVGAIIILLGAQVIADYDRRGFDELEK